MYYIGNLQSYCSIYEALNQLLYWYSGIDMISSPAVISKHEPGLVYSYIGQLKCEEENS